MNRVLLALVACMALLVVACEGQGSSGGGSSSSSTGGGGGGGGGGGTPSATEAQYAQDVLTLVNQERAMASPPRAPLAWHAGMAQVAFAHSADMAARDFFAHTNPDGQSPFDRLAAAGISYSTAGENIAAGYSTPAAVMAAWMASTGHRNNILNGAFTELGVGVKQGGSYGIYWTQVFRAP
ncbi:MAG: CAP domain-containing protein [Planctomycetes bacterium]|jgi:uncharacterized protein YkwD|nr:CAP domain-containing protein [Planctomycetota bacterium]MCL4728996.1 CAP domain-containing protein [Planctomycetota bacterium]